MNDKQDRQLLFSITKKDFIVETFRSGGKGGQHQNKTSSGVRIKHPDSGAVGEARDERSQKQNKRLAFNRLVNSKKFQSWYKIESSKYLGIAAEIEKQIERSVNDKNNIIIEGFNTKTNKWYILEEEILSDEI